MKNSETSLHVRGLSQFIDDRDVPEGTMHAAIFDSPVAFGEIIKAGTFSIIKNQN